MYGNIHGLRVKNENQKTLRKSTIKFILDSVRL